jgi:hypothetical protein
MISITSSSADPSSVVLDHTLSLPPGSHRPLCTLSSTDFLLAHDDAQLEKSPVGRDADSDRPAASPRSIADPEADSSVRQLDHTGNL